MKLFSVSSLFLLVSASSLVIDSAFAQQQQLRNGRFVRIRGRPRQARNFGRRVVRVQQQPAGLFFQQQARQARTGYETGPAPAAPLELIEVREEAKPAQSYGAPIEGRQEEAPAPAYGAPVEQRQEEAPAPAYGAPVEQRQEEAPAPAYGAPVEQRQEEAPAPAYGAPVEQRVEEAPAAPAAPAYGAPQQANTGYRAAAPAPAPVAAPAPVIVAARAPAPVAPVARAQPVRNTYTASAPANQYQASASSASSTRTSASAAAPAAEPIAIVRSVYNSHGDLGYEDSFNFDFEAENGIKQTAEGELRTIDDSEVMVMKGSYSYVDENGEEVVVTWYADETGYHAESDILPVAPEIPFEEQRIAVEAQIKFAQEQLANQASAPSNQFEVSAVAPQQFQGAQIIDARANNQPTYGQN